MSRIDHVRVDKQARRATIGAGVTIRRANKELYEQGLSFPVVGSIDEISVGGLFAAADHGSSMKHASSADRAVSCTLVTADGRIRKIRRDSEDPEEVNLFKATGCGAGATGVIVDITFDLEDAFGLAPKYEEICVRELLKKGGEKGSLIDLAKQNEYVKVRVRAASCYNCASIVDALASSPRSGISRTPRNPAQLQTTVSSGEPTELLLHLILNRIPLSKICRNR